jgi:uncharacterized metal-binding protein YceD (DUF177 family)
MTEEQMKETTFDALMRVDNLPNKGRRLKLELSKGELVMLADKLQIDLINSFLAQLLVVQTTGGLHVSGEIKAQIEQKSVVSLKFVKQEINEQIDRIFLRSKQFDKATQALELFVDMEGDDDLPDYYDGIEIDFSDLLTEILVLSIEQFPRLNDEKLEFNNDEAIPDKISPFAILKNMKNN